MVDSLVLLKILSLIAAMLGLIYLAYKMTTKMALKHNNNASKLLHILEYRRIDQRNAICVIKVGHEHYLLALGAEAMCLEKIHGLE